MPESTIVINTGPIIALIAATGDLSLLSKLYSRVIVPREVCDEVLANGGTPICDNDVTRRMIETQAPLQESAGGW